MSPAKKAPAAKTSVKKTAAKKAAAPKPSISNAQPARAGQYPTQPGVPPPAGA